MLLLKFTTLTLYFFKLKPFFLKFNKAIIKYFLIEIRKKIGNNFSIIIICLFFINSKLNWIIQKVLKNWVWVSIRWFSRIKKCKCFRIHYDLDQFVLLNIFIKKVRLNKDEWQTALAKIFKKTILENCSCSGEEKVDWKRF